MTAFARSKPFIEGAALALATRLSGFRSRAGKPFRARLVLTPDGKVEFDFPPRPSRDGDSAPADEQTAEPAAAE